MAHKIVTSSLLSSNVLSVDAKGVKIQQGWNKKQFAFNQIDLVLVSAKNILSLQAGGTVFSIKIRPEHPKHQATLNALLQELRKTAPDGTTLAS